PVPMSDAFAVVLPDAPRLVSGAGHDAMVLAAAGVPSSMLFVRSLNGGVSHHPDELSSDEDIALAVDALTDALARIVSCASAKSCRGTTWGRELASSRRRWPTTATGRTWCSGSRA